MKEKSMLLSEFVGLIRDFTATAGNRVYNIHDAFVFWRAQHALQTSSERFECRARVTEEKADEFDAFISSMDLGLEIFIMREQYIYFKDDVPMLLVSGLSGSSNMTASLTGDVEYVNRAEKILKDKFVDTTMRMYSVQLADGEVKSMPTTVERAAAEVTAPKEHYPYLKQGADEFMHSFIASRNNVVLMIGPPGTGKSTYLRAMAFAAHGLRSKVLVINSDHVVDSELFGPWIERTPHDAVIIVEDADSLVSKRTEGNRNMSMLLNQIDGVIPTDRKFVISTNLSNLSKVDAALVRPGRCYEVLSFRKLHHDEADAVYRKINNTDKGIEDTGDLSLAEVLNYDSDIETLRRTTNFGFNAS